jgi:hypothetical protein
LVKDAVRNTNPIIRGIETGIVRVVVIKMAESDADCSRVFRSVCVDETAIVNLVTVTPEKCQTRDCDVPVPAVQYNP